MDKTRVVSATVVVAPREHTVASVKAKPGSATSVVGASDRQSAATLPWQSAKVGDCIKGRFDLLEVLGTGGMGVVYRARDRRQKELGESDPYLALKVLNDSLQYNEAALVALQQECRKSQLLAHPNIVNVFDFDRDRRLAFITMELLHGQPLDRVLYAPDFQGEPLDVIAPQLREIASALAYAHEKGVIHSDFKPGNLWLTEDGSVKVFDFGIARVMQRLEADDEPGGQLAALTPAYASLGMLTQQPPSVADDLYAFAVVIYYWLTGRHPYQRKTAEEVWQARLVPARPKGLDDDAWKMLRQALDPEKSATLTVKDFMAGFLPESAGVSVRVIRALAALLCVIACAGLFWIYQGWRDDQFAADLGSNDHPRIVRALQGMAQLPDSRQSELLQRERASLIQHALGWAQSRAADGRFLEAGEYLEQFVRMFPDSRQLSQARHTLQRDMAERKRELEHHIHKTESHLLSLTPEQAAQWLSELQQLQWIQPDHDLLSAVRLGAKLTPLIHSQLFLGEKASAQALLAHPVMANVEPEVMAKLSLLVSQYRQRQRRSESGSAAGFDFVKKRATHDSRLLSEAQRALLEPQPQRDPLATERLLNDLLQQIERIDPGFAEAFRWALSAQQQGS